MKPVGLFSISLVWILLLFYQISRAPKAPDPFPSQDGVVGPSRGPYNPALAASLNQGLRDFWQKPDQVLDALGSLTDLKVADIGCGEGYFSLRLLERVGPQGRVLATDIQQEVLDTLASRIAPADRDRIRLIHASETSTGIEEQVDLVLVVQVLGEVSDRKQFLASIRKIMHHDSRLVIIDSKHITNPENGFTRPLNTTALLRELQRAGFQTAPEYVPSSFDFLPKQFFLVLKPS